MKIVMIVNTVDAPAATCDPGAFSDPTSVNLEMEDDSGSLPIDNAGASCANKA